MTTEPFSLRALIREVLAETDETNLDSLTGQVFSATGDDYLEEAYAQALPSLIRQVIGAATRPYVSLPGQISSEAPTATAGEGHSHAGTQALSTLPGGQNLINSRVARFRRNRYRISVHVASKEYRHILDCTREDLAFAASESHAHADANRAAAHRYERLIKAMEQRSVTTVGELTDLEIDALLAMPAGVGDE